MREIQASGSPRHLSFTSDQLSRVIDEYGLQVSVSEAQHEKSLYCYRLLGELYQHGYLTARKTTDWILALDVTTKYPAPYDELWRQFVENMISDLFDTVLKANRVSARRIFDEMHRSLYLPPIPPREPGLFERLLVAMTGSR